jgi:transcriptional regulator with XRE-family HTH domain
LIEKRLPTYDAPVGTVGTATFGGNMRREREARGLTLEAVAQRLGLKRAAPLSTLERSHHVPKAETIREYAAAIGCEPAALLAGVVTEHDALRGSAAPTAAVAARTERLTRNETRALQLMRLIADEGQPDALRALVLHARAFPREQSATPTVRTARIAAGTSRTKRGKR